MNKPFLLVIFLSAALLSFISFARATTPPQTASKETAVLVGAGDVADCANLAGAEATANLLEEIPGTVMMIGDSAYPDGSKENFECYEKTWGRFKSRTRPSVGNHEFHRWRNLLLSILWRSRGRSEEWLLQLRTRNLAHCGSQQRMQGSRRL